MRPDNEIIPRRRVGQPPPPPEEPPAQRRRGGAIKLLLLLLFILGAIQVWTIFNGDLVYDTTRPPTEARSTAETLASVNTQNAGSDQSMTMDTREREQIMALAIASAGYACKVTKHLFKGLHKSDAYHLAVCENGSAYLVTFPIGPTGEVIVLDCAVAAAVGTDCFAKW
jgi:hypothetical protein